MTQRERVLKIARDCAWSHLQVQFRELDFTPTEGLTLSEVGILRSYCGWSAERFIDLDLRWHGVRQLRIVIIDPMEAWWRESNGS